MHRGESHSQSKTRSSLHPLHRLEQSWHRRSTLSEARGRQRVHGRMHQQIAQHPRNQLCSLRRGATRSSMGNQNSATLHPRHSLHTRHRPSSSHLPSTHGGTSWTTRTMAAHAARLGVHGCISTRNIQRQRGRTIALPTRISLRQHWSAIGRTPSRQSTRTARQRQPGASTKHHPILCGGIIITNGTPCHTPASAQQHGRLRASIQHHGTAPGQLSSTDTSAVSAQHHQHTASTTAACSLAIRATTTQMCTTSIRPGITQLLHGRVLEQVHSRGLHHIGALRWTLFRLGGSFT